MKDERRIFSEVMAFLPWLVIMAGGLFSFLGLERIQSELHDQEVLTSKRILIDEGLRKSRCSGEYRIYDYLEDLAKVLSVDNAHTGSSANALRNRDSLAVFYKEVSRDQASLNCHKRNHP
jgi:hypothetical protein